MTKREYIEAIALLEAAFNRTMTKEQHRAWYAVLQDLDVEPVKAAVIAFLAEGDDWPTIAKIRRLATEQAEGTQQPHTEAFDRVMRMVRSYGYPFKDRLGDILTPDQIAAVNQCGGWMRFCDCPPDQKGTLAAQFRDAWKEHTGSRRRRQNLPEAVRPKLEHDHALKKLSDKMGAIE